MGRFSYEVGYGIHGHTRILRHLREELAWAEDKRLLVIMQYRKLIPY